MLEAGDAIGALAAARESWRHQPHASTAFIIHRCHAAIGNGSDSSAWLHAAYEMNPRHNRYAHALARHLFELGRFNSAGRICVDVLRQNATFAPCRDVMLDVSRATGVDPEHAVASWPTRSWVEIRYPERHAVTPLVPNSVWLYRGILGKPVSLTVRRVSRASSREIARAICTAGNELQTSKLSHGKQGQTILIEQGVLAMPGWERASTPHLAANRRSLLRTCYLTPLEHSATHSFRLDPDTLALKGADAPVNPAAERNAWNAALLIKSYIAEDLSAVLSEREV